jgi:hypothetical protein
MITSGVLADITFGGATSTGSLTVNAGLLTTLNLMPIGAVNFNGLAAGIISFGVGNGFNAINIYSSTAVPTAVQLINFSRPTVTFTNVANLMMYPYNVIFTSTIINLNETVIPNTSLTLIKTIAPLTTIPSTLQINTTNKNFDLRCSDLLINGKILNEGALLGVSYAGYIYLTSDNDIGVIALPATTISARVGTVNGDVKINCAGDLTVQGGTLAGLTPGAFAQIGEQVSTVNPTVNSDIYLTIGGDVNIIGGTAPTVATSSSDFACIGHGQKTPPAGINPPTVTYNGNIIINSIGGDLNLTAGGTITPLLAAVEGVARLGHGILDVSTSYSYFLTGDIRGLLSDQEQSLMEI